MIPMKSSPLLLIFLFLLATGAFLYSGCQNRGVERSDSAKLLQEWPPPLEERAKSWSAEPIPNCLAFMRLDKDPFDGDIAAALEDYQASLLPDFTRRSIETTEEEIEKRYHQIQGRFPIQEEFHYFLTSINATPALLRFAICRDLQLETSLASDLNNAHVASEIIAEIEKVLPAYTARFEAAGLELSEEELRENLRERLQSAWVHFFHEDHLRGSFGSYNAGLSAHEWHRDRVHQFLETSDEEPDRTWLRRQYRDQHQPLLLSTTVERRFALWLGLTYTLEQEELLLVAGADPQPLLVHSTLPGLTVLAPDWVFIKESPTEYIRHDLLFEERPGGNGPELHMATLQPHGGWEQPLATLAYLNLRYMSSDHRWTTDLSAPQTRTFRCGSHCPDGLATPPMSISLTSKEGHRASFEEAICRIDPEPRYITSEDQTQIEAIRQQVGCEEEVRADLLERNSPDSLTSLSEAQQVYRNQCAVCHGTTGRGDGPAGVALGRLADFTAPETFQYGSSPLAILQVLRDGIDDRAMPSFQHLPEDLLWELAHFVNQMSEEDTTSVEPERLEAICTQYSRKAALQVLDDPC